MPTHPTKQATMAPDGTLKKEEPAMVKKADASSGTIVPEVEPRKTPNLEPVETTGRRLTPGVKEVESPGDALDVLEAESDQLVSTHNEQIAGGNPSLLDPTRLRQQTSESFGNFQTQVGGLTSRVTEALPRDLPNVVSDIDSLLLRLEKYRNDTRMIPIINDLIAKRQEAQARIQSELNPLLEAEATAQEQFQQAQGFLGDLQARARGEGLEDTAAQQQLAEQMAGVRDQAADRFRSGSQLSARAQSQVARQQQALAAGEERTSELLRAQEQQLAERMASGLAADLSQELANQDFADANVQARIAEIYNNSSQAMQDIQSDLRAAQLLDAARREQYEAEAEDQWMRTMLGSAFTVAGTAVGAMYGGPAGAMLGGSVGGALGQSISG